jgi:hypothetical protein
MQEYRMLGVAQGYKSKCQLSSSLVLTKHSLQHISP